MSHQDWDPITIHRGASSMSRLTPKVSADGIRVKQTATVSEMRKLETAETGKPKMLTPKSRADMAAARVAKGLTQKQLDMQCCFPPNSVNAWEAGRICPTSQQIQALHRVLQIKLERA